MNPELMGVPDNRQHEPGYYEKLGKKVAADQPENKFKAAEKKLMKNFRTQELRRNARETQI